MGRSLYGPLCFFYDARELTTLYFKQLAWLHSHEDRDEAEIPDLNSYEQWIIDTTQEIGFGTAERPTGYQDLMGWCHFSGVTFTSEEAQLIISLCRTFITSTQVYKEAGSLPPYLTDEGAAKISTKNIDSWLNMAVEK